MSTSALQNPTLQTPSSRLRAPSSKLRASRESGLFDPRVLLAFTLCSVGVFLAALGFAITPTPPGWSLITAPSPGNDLYSVTCASPSDCWAVGYHIEHWDGTSWTIVPSPPNGGILDGVACASGSLCWAVGYFQSGSLYQTIIERWNGTSWSIISSPNPGTQYNFLYSVTCSTADCWAVGYSKNTGGLAQTFILRSAGTSWAVFPSPNYPNLPASNVLNSVTCATASDCWAVGWWSDGESGDALMEHWNGASWSIVASPATGLGFISVACASSSECLALGTGSYQSGQWLIELWNGTSWAIVPSAIPSPSNDWQLFNVACGSPSECWAVGYYNNNITARTLIEKWDGSTWSIASSPNSGTSTSGNYVFGATCASAAQCWAVGYYTTNTRQALIEEFAPTIPALTSVDSVMTHGTGSFSINLPLTGPRGVECRSSASLGAGNYTVVFTFVNNVTSCGTASTGSLSSGPGSNQCTVNLTGVPNQQYTTVTLNNVLDVQNNTGNVSATMGVLIGDVNANGTLTNADVSLVKAQVASGGSVDPAGSNFRTDINANGVISNADVSLTKAQVAAGAQLPSPP